MRPLCGDVGLDMHECLDEGGSVAAHGLTDAFDLSFVFASFEDGDRRVVAHCAVFAECAGDIAGGLRGADEHARRVGEGGEERQCPVVGLRGYSATVEVGDDFRCDLSGVDKQRGVCFGEVEEGYRHGV